MAQLVMKRPQGAAEYDRDSIIAVREATNADADAMAALLGSAFPELEWNAARVRKDLLDATDVHAVFVIDDGGGITATASVRYVERFPDSGYVHWVAVDPRHRGKRLSHVVMGRVLGRFLDDGKQSAILETDDVRLPAITAYLGLGFIPYYTDTDHEDRWSRVFTLLGQSRHTAKDRPK